MAYKNPYWKNPSKTAEVWDRRNNRHIRPGEIVFEEPDVQAVRQGKLIRVDPTDAPKPEAATAAPQMVSSLIIEDDDDSLELADSPEPKPKKKTK